MLLNNALNSSQFALPDWKKTCKVSLQMVEMMTVSREAGRAFITLGMRIIFGDVDVCRFKGMDLCLPASTLMMKF